MNNSNFHAPAPLVVRLYGSASCSQCNEAALLLSALRDEFDFRVEKVDIESDLALREKLKGKLPVVTFGGANRVQMPLTPEKLRRAFKKSAQLTAKECPAL